MNRFLAIPILFWKIPKIFLILMKSNILIKIRMSIESNVSEKVQLNKRKSDLFDHLVNQSPYSPSKIKNQYRISTQNLTNHGQKQLRFTQYNRMSNQQVAFNLNFQNKLKEQQVLLNKNSSIKQQFKQDSPQVKITCKCYKSKCLQLYCECFSKGILCNPECQCYQCRNNADFEDKLQKARNSILQKDPQAFSNKLQIVGNIETETNLANKKGCNCKKTLCFKKYCECFYSGVKCTYLCKCENCLNGGQRPFKE